MSVSLPCCSAPSQAFIHSFSSICRLVVTKPLFTGTIKKINRKPNCFVLIILIEKHQDLLLLGFANTTPEPLLDSTDGVLLCNGVDDRPQHPLSVSLAHHQMLIS